MWVKLSEPRFFQRNIIIVIEVVQAYDLIAPIEKRPCGMKADKACGARYEKFHACRTIALVKGLRHFERRKSAGTQPRCDIVVQ